MKNEETIIKKVITYQESDFVGHYRLANIFSTLADLATLNALQIGIWRDERQEQYGWILTKQTLKMNRPIQINEDIIFSTRAGTSTRVQFTRLYDIFDKNNDCIGGVHSTWTCIDLHKRRIVRPDKIGISLPEIEEHPHMVEEYEEIKKDVLVKCYKERSVVYSDIDVNQHMNNYRYIEWALDVMDEMIFKTHYISEVSVSFKKEMPPKTTAKIFYGQKENYFKVMITSQDEETVHFEMGGYLEKF